MFSTLCMANTYATTTTSTTTSLAVISRVSDALHSDKYTTTKTTLVATNNVSGALTSICYYFRA